MAKYRKVETRIWNDAKFRSLSDRGQLVFFFLLTHPHLTPLGAMRATVEGLASELNHWTTKGFREAFGEAFAKGMVKHDPEACFVWLPNFLRYNTPESPNVVRSWAKCWDDIPECALKVELWQEVEGFAEGLSKGFAKAFGEAFAKGMPNQEQEQEQEQEQDISPPTPLAGGESETRKAWCERIYQAYPKHVGKADALKAIDTALRRPPGHEFHVTAEDLLAAVQDFARAVDGADKQFVPGPATWIRKARWCDERDDWQRIGRSDQRHQQPGREAREQQFTAW